MGHGVPDTRRHRRLLVLGALAVALVFLALDLHYTGGEVVLPLDDSYIYAQYARAIAEGHPFRYTPGAEPSTGTTGLLYPLLLAPAYLAGARGGGLPAFMFLLNALLLAISAALAFEVAGGNGRRGAALLAGWLLVLSGPLAWGALSGMEVGLFVTLWLALALALVREGSAGRRDRWSVAWASLLTLVRPEGLLWAGLLWILLPFTPGRRDRGKVTRLIWLIPLAVGLLPLLVNLAISGSLAPAAAHPKSPLYLPGHHLPTLLRHATGFLIAAVKGLLAGTGGPEITGPLNRLDLWAFVAPFTLVFLIIGAGTALARAARVRRVDPPALWSWWLLAALGWAALSTGTASHHFRYLLPAWPALVLLVARGADLLAGVLAPEGGRLDRQTAFRTIGGYLAAFGLLTVATFALLYGQEAHGFARQYLGTARWIDRNLPPDARIASLDAGILGYASNRELFDLFGLTSPAMRETTVFYAEDAGSKFEMMERLPGGQRPTHFVLHDRRHDFGGRNPYAALIPTGAGGLPRILHAAGVDIEVPVVGPRLLVWAADWNLAHGGDRPGGPVGGRIVDRVDLADLRSEREHRLRILPAAPGFLGTNRIDRLRCADGRMVTDGGRGIAGDLTVRLTGLSPGRELTLRLRTLPSPAPVDLRLAVDGKVVHLWTLAATEGGSWLEAEARVAGERVRTGEVEVTLSGRFLGHHLWAVQ